MRKIFLFGILLSAVSALAQFTTVTGTVVDPHNVPYALGTITPTLVVPSGAGSPTLNGNPYSPPSGPVNLDKNGSFSFNVADNNVLLPAGTKWNFQVCSGTGTVQPAFGTGSQCFSLAAPITVTGSTQSLSTNLNAVALALTVPFTGSGGNPASPVASIQTNLNGTAFGSVSSVAPGSFLTSAGTSSFPAYQTKLTFDLRDAHPPAAAFACDGVTYDTSAAVALVSAIGGQPAKVQGPSGVVCAMGDFVWPANIVLDFSTGWQIKTPTDSTTTPGSATFNTGSSAIAHCQSDNTTPTCNMSVTATANDTYIIGCGRGFTGGALSFTSNVAGDIVLPLATSNTGLSSITQAAMIPNVTAGAHTFTATSGGNLIGSCTAVPISGLGPTPFTQDAVAICSNSSATSPYTCTGTFTSGDFLLFVASQNNTAETCTSAGGGFTLISGAAGCSTTTISNMAMAYQNSAAGGSVTPTISFTPSPAGHNPASLIIGLRPSTAINIILGTPFNPANRQIFQNAAGSVGGIDFTGNLIPFHVYPEWWGAGYGASDATNLAALQASEHGAYGTTRTNGDGQSAYNKVWHWAQPYHINGEIKMYNVIGVSPGSRAQLVCDPGAGITQDSTNQRIFDMQSVAYWDGYNCIASTQASQDISHPLMDNDWNGTSTPNNLKPQFTTLYNWVFSGNGVASIGLLGAKSGGAAQYSNEYCVDCAFSSFTQACYQIGTPANAATNALAIGFSGDMQGCTNYGIVTYGGGYVSISAGSNGISSMENGFTTQTGFDIAGAAMQGPCVVEHLRSESRKLASCPQLVMKDSRNIDQSALITPGTTQPVGTYMHADYVTGDGAYHKVTVNSSAFAGLGTYLAPLQASSGTSTSLTDTNQTVAGSITIGSIGSTATETMTQNVTGSTGTRLNSPANGATIAGTLTSGTFAFGDTAQQATTGVTCTVGSGNTTTNLNCSNFSGTPDSSHTYTDLTTLATFNPSATPVFAAASPVLLITAATGSPDNHNDWVGATTGLHYTPTAVPANQANYTVNAFTGLNLGISFGTDTFCFGTITSNTAQTINFSSLTTNYPNVACVAPDSTSAFFVACPVTHGTDTCGGITMVYVNENTIAGDIVFTGNGFQGRLEDVIAPGDQIQVSSLNQPEIHNLQTTRSDWFTSNVDPQQGFTSYEWDVRPIRTGTPNGVQASWNLPALTGHSFKGGPHQYFGTKPICWMTGTVGSNTPLPANTSANDICGGGRSYNGLGTDMFVQRFEIQGAPGVVTGIGPPVPTGTDQNGLDFPVMGGPSTGAGTPGSVCFGVGNTGSSGITPNSGTQCNWKVVGSTGNIVDQGSHSIQPSLYATKTNCAQTGSVANPSLVACGSAPAGAFSCDVAASAGTCVVSTTAVGANSQIIVQETTKENTRLGVTCNTSPTVIPAIIVASQVAGTSFTINMPTITTNPACFDYWIVNQ